jgi:hypothetical protein
MILQPQQRTILLSSSLLFLITSSLILSATSMLATHPEVAIGLTYDLTLVSPLVYFLLIRKTQIPNTTIVPFFVLSLLFASYILPAQSQQHLGLIKQFVLPMVELGVLGFVIYKIRQARKLYKQNAHSTFDFFTTMKAALREIMPARAAEAVASEFSVFYYGFFNWKKRVFKANEFSHHRKSGTPALLGVLMFMSIVEAVALHFLIEHLLNALVAWVCTALSVYTALQIFGFMRSLSKRATIVCPEELKLHYGTLAEAYIAWVNIAEIQVLAPTHQVAYNKQHRSLSPLGEMEKPNVMIRLHNPSKLTTLYGFKRSFSTLYLHIDTPQEFVNTVQAQIN